MAKKKPKTPPEMEIPDGTEGEGLESPFETDTETTVLAEQPIPPGTTAVPVVGKVPPAEQVVPPIQNVAPAAPAEPTVEIEYFSKQYGLLIIIEPDVAYVATPAGFVQQTGKRYECKFVGNVFKTTNPEIHKKIQEIAGYGRQFWPIKSTDIPEANRDTRYTSGAASTVSRPNRQEDVATR